MARFYGKKGKLTINGKEIDGVTGISINKPNDSEKAYMDKITLGEMRVEFEIEYLVLNRPYRRIHCWKNYRIWEWYN